MLQTKNLKITLKKATENDLKTILEIEETQSKNKLYVYLKSIDEVKKYFEGNIIYLIYVNKIIAGHIMYSTNGLRTAEITGFIVLPKFINRGIGTFVFEKILRELSDRNIKQIELKVHPQNEDALKIYFKHGFKIKGRLENNFNDGESRLLLKNN